MMVHYSSQDHLKNLALTNPQKVLLICAYPPRKITMAKSTHKSSSKKSSSAKMSAKRRTSPTSKTKELSKSVTYDANIYIKHKPRSFPGGFYVSAVVLQEPVAGAEQCR